MNTFKKVYLKIREILFKTKFGNKISYLYNYLFHHERIFKIIKRGKNDIKYLIIRPSSEDGVQGLMSLLIQALRWLEFCDKNDYIPYIDFKIYKTQYYDGINNSWELFFKQPAISKNPIYESNNSTIAISGFSKKELIDFSTFKDSVFTNKSMLRRCHNIISKYIALSDDAQALVDKENQILHTENCIGVYIRGTDYVKLKPSGEYVQPNIDEVINKTREFFNKYSCKIFLVTEDYDYYLKMREEFKDQLSITSFDSFVKNYDGKTYLSKSGLLNDDKKTRGANYLAKIMLLSRCKYFIGSITCGSIATYAFNGGKYKDEFVFNLGKYH